MPKLMYRFFKAESRRVRVPKDVLALLRQRFASVNRHRRVPQELRALPFIYAVSRSGDPKRPWQVYVVRRDGEQLAWPRPIQFKALWNSGKHRPRVMPVPVESIAIAQDPDHDLNDRATVEEVGTTEVAARAGQLF